jgi:type IV pilus assembly protein PilM
MIYRTYIGLDLQSSVMRAVPMRRRGRSLTLIDGRLIGLAPGVLSPSFRRENILDQDAFVSALREVLDPISGAEERLSLALPERAGRILLTQVETALVNKAEGVEILKWQLRDTLPADGALQLDYQILDRDESGRQHVLVSCITEEVLKQYEDCFNLAGYGAEKIDFRSLCQVNFYRNRLESDDDFVLILLEEQSLVMQVYQGRIPVYHRACEITGDVESVYSELSRVLAGERSRLGGLRRETIYLHSSADENEELISVLKSLFERDSIIVLDPELSRFGAEDLSLNKSQMHSLITAVGAAERLL